MRISLLVAATENNVIGKENKLLWHLPNDMAFFKNTTWAMPVIMGRKTFESLGKPLKGRTNIIITRDERYTLNDNNSFVVKSFDEALSQSRKTDAKESFVLGGGEIFRMTIDLADRIYMTRVHAVLEGDTFFPEFDRSAWHLKCSHHFQADSKHAYPYTFETWDRKTAIT